MRNLCVVAVTVMRPFPRNSDRENCGHSTSLKSVKSLKCLKSPMSPKERARSGSMDSEARREALKFFPRQFLRD
jgi:hypothetical protein